MAERSLRLAEIAADLGRPIEGDPETRVTGVASLEAAAPSELVFVRSPAYAEAFASSRARAAIVPDGLDAGDRAVIRSPNPALDFARVATYWTESTAEPGVAHSARIASSAKVDPSARVEPGVVVGDHAEVGPRTVLHAAAVVYPGAQLGGDCVIHSGAVLREGARLGDRVVVGAGAILGGDGFGFVTDEQGQRVRMPQLGGLVVEDDVEIGANTTIDRGSLGDTRIRRGAKIDNLVQIAHNCDVGEGAIIVAQSGLSGSTRVGAGAIIMAQAGSAGHLEIGAGAFVAARSGLHKDVRPGARVYGAPPLEDRAWHRMMVAMKRLPELLRRVRALERALDASGRAKSRASDEDSR